MINSSSPFINSELNRPLNQSQQGSGPERRPAESRGLVTELGGTEQEGRREAIRGGVARIDQVHTPSSNPTQRLDQSNGFQVMSSAQLLNRLSEMGKPGGKQKATDPKQFFKQINKPFLQYNLYIQPHFQIHIQSRTQKIELPPMAVNVKTLMNQLGVNTFILKGSSAIHWENLTPERDIDLATPVEQVDQQQIEKRLVRFFQNLVKAQAKNLSSEQRQALSALSDAQWLKAFTCNPKSDEGWCKWRINTATGAQASSPVDLLFYHHLAAPFDVLTASTRIDIDLSKQSAKVNRAIDKSVEAWLENAGLVWFHEDMTGGLDRVSYRFHKKPHLQCLQPTVVNQLFENSTQEERGRFLGRLLSGSIPIQAERKAALTPIWQALLTTLLEKCESEPWVGELKASLQGWLHSDPQFHCDDQLTLANLQDAEKAEAIAQSISRGLQILQSTREDFMKLVEEHPLSVVTLDFDALFEKPSLKAMSDLWVSSSVRSNPAIQLLLWPMTDYYGWSASQEGEGKTLVDRMAYQLESNHVDKPTELFNAAKLYLHKLESSASESDAMTLMIAMLTDCRQWSPAQLKANKSAVSALITRATEQLAKGDTHVEQQNQLLHNLLNMSLNKKQLQALQHAYQPLWAGKSVDELVDQPIPDEIKSLGLFALLQSALVDFNDAMQNPAKTVKSPRAYDAVTDQLMQISDIADQAGTLMAAKPVADQLHYQNIQGGGYRFSAVLSEGSLLYSDETGLYVGALKGGQRHGEGCLWGQDLLIRKGHFTRGLLDDQKALILYPEQARFVGEIRGNKAVGRGVLTFPPSALPLLFKSIVNLFIKEPDAADLPNASDVFMSGSFQGKDVLSSEMSDLIKSVVDGQMTLRNSGTGESVNLSYQQGRMDEVRIDRYRGQPAQLVTHFHLDDSNSEHLFPGKRVSKWVINLNQVELTHKKEGLTIKAPYHPIDKAVMGLGMIQGEDHLYCGGVYDFETHGSGQYVYSDGRPSRFIQSIMGELKDPDLELMMGHIRHKQPNLYNLYGFGCMYEVPPLSFRGHFALSNAPAQKVFGLTDQGRVTGIAKGVGPEGSQLYRGDMIYMSQWMHFQYIELSNVQPRVDHLVLMQGRQGAPSPFLMHGSGELIDVGPQTDPDPTQFSASIANEHLEGLADRTIAKHNPMALLFSNRDSENSGLYFMGEFISSIVMHFPDGTECAVRIEEFGQKSNEDYYYVTRYQGDSGMSYEGGMKVVENENGETKAFMHGQGILFQNSVIYKGTFNMGHREGSFEVVHADGRKEERFFESS